MRELHGAQSFDFLIPVAICCAWFFMEPSGTILMDPGQALTVYTKEHTTNRPVTYKNSGHRLVNIAVAYAHAADYDFASSPFRLIPLTRDRVDFISHAKEG
jgi:hypothetical protein